MVLRLAQRRGVWLGDDLTAITLIASLIDQAERCLPELVTSARANGHTWHEIARALATSPAEAGLRFDPQSRSPTAGGLTITDPCLLQQALAGHPSEPDSPLTDAMLA